MTSRAVCTIIAKNYVAFARTLAQSFLARYPDGKVYVLIVDDFEGYIDSANECFEIVKLSDLQIPNLSELCFKYNLKELCTAVKADLLEHLIRERSIDRLIYLDPDILVTGPLDEIYEKLGSYDIVLTPHLDADYPDDDLLPDDGFILRAGQFNLGFIGVNSSENASLFLDWWKRKLHQNCVVDVANGYFVDQRFIDFVLIFFTNVFVEKGVGYNVAYWNLHSRRLRETADGWRCNDGALNFFHFSGYDPGTSSISKHIADSAARYRLSNRSDLKKLFADYKNLLLANGYARAIEWPYAFGSFKSGERVPDELRKYFRELRSSARPRDPFGSEEDLKSAAGIESNYAKDGLSSSEQLDAIINSRAWRWVTRYGRFKNRYLSPPCRFMARMFGRSREQRAKGKVQSANQP